MVTLNGGRRQPDDADHQTGPLSSAPTSQRRALKLYLVVACLALQCVLVHAQPTTQRNDDVFADHHHKLESSPAKECQFPHIVLLRFHGREILQCAGSLIDSRHVITAAHCLSQGPREISAYFGSVVTTQMPIKISVENYTMHGDFVQNKKCLLNDVAILRLSEAVNTSDCIKPISLATSHQYYEGSCVVAGWGVKTYDGPLSTRLHYTSLPIIPLKHCQDLSPYLQDQHLCAGELGPDGRTTCKGDSGSPLMCLDAHKKERILAGIVSYGWKCKTGLSVYARVSFFHPWIMKHIL